MWNLFKVSNKDATTTSLVSLLLGLNTFHIVLLCLECWHWTGKCRGWDSKPWYLWKYTFQKIIACRGVLGSLSNLVPPWTTNCLGTQTLQFLVETNPSNFCFCQVTVCVFSFVCMLVKDWSNQSEDEIYWQN